MNDNVGKILSSCWLSGKSNWNMLGAEVDSLNERNVLNGEGGYMRGYS